MPLRATPVRHAWLIALCISGLAHTALMVWLSMSAVLGWANGVRSSTIRAVRIQTLQLHTVSKGVHSRSAPPVQQVSAVLRPDPDAKGADVSIPEPQPVKSEHEEAPKVELAAQNELPLTEALYFSADELTVKPAFLGNGGAADTTYIPDVYPLPVVVHLFIGAQGDVDKVLLEESFLSDTAKKFILDTFSPMKFTPGMLGTFAVKSQLTIEVKLNPSLPGH